MFLESYTSFKCQIGFWGTYAFLVSVIFLIAAICSLSPKVTEVAVRILLVAGLLLLFERALIVEGWTCLLLSVTLAFTSAPVVEDVDDSLDRE